MSATRSKGEAGLPQKENGGAVSLYRLLSSVKLTVFLLSFIAVGSVFGTVIRQRATVDEYLSQYSRSSYAVMKFLGLDDVYHSWWFYAALLFFAVNLSLCTINRLRALRKRPAAPVLPDERRLSEMEQKFMARGKDVDYVLDHVGRGYRKVLEGPEGTVLEKGALSRYGVLVVHGSVILILLGSLIGLIWGYRGFVILTKGETKNQITLRDEGRKSIPLGFDLRCKDFQVSFYSTGAPKDYVSDVEVIENGKIVLTRKIRVNEPLSYNGIRLYQANYGKIPSFRLKIGDEDVVLKERDRYKKGNLNLMVVRFSNMVHNFGPGVQIAYMEGNEPKAAWFLTNVERLRQRTIGGVDVRLEEIKEEFFTGLEASRDPGVPVVWTGFAAILLGLYINFFVYFRRIYLRKVPGGTLVAGMAPRNRDSLRIELENLEKRVNNNE